MKSAGIWNNSRLQDLVLRESEVFLHLFSIAVYKHQIDGSSCFVIPFDSLYHKSAVKFHATVDALTIVRFLS